MRDCAPGDIGAAGPAPPSAVPLPGAPIRVSAVATDGQAEVDWMSPRVDGGTGISKYVVTSSPPGAGDVVPGGQTRASINGLPNGRRFTFTVAAANASGQGRPSAPSNEVTPQSLSTFVSTVSIRSLQVMFNGGPCLDQGSQCFGIQQNSFVDTALNGEYWIQNVVFIEDTVQHGWEAEGNYEIWNGAQQSIVACDGALESGSNGTFCAWPMVWRPLTFPARLTLTSTVADGDVVLSNSLGDVFPAWSPGPGGVQSIVDPHEAAGPSWLSLYAPETVIVGETGRHNATFVGGSGSIGSQMTLADGRTTGPESRCIAQSADTSTGETGVGFYWTDAARGGSSAVVFTAHRGGGADGDEEGPAGLGGMHLTRGTDGVGARRRRHLGRLGGAMAFAYYGEPRATVDIDLNLFVSPMGYQRYDGPGAARGDIHSDPDVVTWGRPGAVVVGSDSAGPLLLL